MERKKPGRSGSIALKKEAVKDTSASLKEIERAIHSISLYPSSVEEEAKDASVRRIVNIYEKGGEAVRQHVLLTLFESIAHASEIKALHTYEYYRSKSPKAGPGALRMSVYRDIFNFNASAEGISELILLLGELKGDQPAKLLTHLLSHYCSAESETNRILRNAAVDALAVSDSPYALRALLRIASLTDNEHLLGRLSSALVDWDDKLDVIKIRDKAKFKKKLQEVLTREEAPARQYG